MPEAAAARGRFLGYAPAGARGGAGPGPSCPGSRGSGDGPAAGLAGTRPAAMALSAAPGCCAGERGPRWRRPWKLLALGLLSASSVLAAAPGAGAMSREEKRRLG